LTTVHELDKAYRVLTLIVFNIVPFQWRIFSGRGFTPGIFLGGVEDRGQREWGSRGGSPLVKGSTQFANELNPYSD
jgi:hypothetical protein